MNIYPTRRVLAQLDSRGLAWADVVADLEQPETVTPVAWSESRLRVAGARWTGFVEPAPSMGENDYVLVGVRDRERASVAAGSEVVGQEVAQALRGRSGGRGSLWPTTWAELLERLGRIPGVSLEFARKHVVVYKDGKQVDSLPKTSSDHRALLNASHQLKRKGIDVRRP